MNQLNFTFWENPKSINLFIRIWKIVEKKMTQWSEYSCVYQVMSNQSITYEILTGAFQGAERGFNHIQLDCI